MSHSPIPSTSVAPCATAGSTPALGSKPATGVLLEDDALSTEGVAVAVSPQALLSSRRNSAYTSAMVDAHHRVVDWPQHRARLIQ